MKAKGLNCTADEVNAWLSGRKTQFRVAIKHQPPSSEYQLTTCLDTTGDRRNVGKHQWRLFAADGYTVLKSDNKRFKCPYQVGDRLWVRETWSELGYWNEEANNIVSKTKDTDGHERNIIYFEKSPDFEWLDGDEYHELRKDGSYASHWRPSTHMPEWASRIHREITEVKVERLRDISKEDICLEGWGNWSKRLSYKNFWNSLPRNKNHQWDSNPFVFVFDTKIIEVK